MLTISTRPIRLLLISLAFVGMLTAASMVSAEAARDAAECGSWTLFPDFRCDNRQGRPDGAFNPVGMPYLFEDPYITSNLNFAYLYHNLPSGLVFDGGDAQVLALQIRLAITDKLAFIATKDGLMFLQPGSRAAIRKATKIMDMTMGLKYALFETERRDFIFTPAIRYEIPMGSRKVFQNYGDGVFIVSSSFRWGLERLGLDGANVVGSVGGQIPLDGNANVESVFYNLHLDYGFELQNSVVKYIVPFLEVNGMHYTNSGRGTNPVYTTPAYGGGTLPLGVAQTALMTGPFEGFDVGNLGSARVNGNDVVVMGGGFRIPTTWGVSFAVMYEGALTKRIDIHDKRFTFMATWEM